tara:strand:+ start:1389 stop:1745 length:357 start_codon:yes stop_codon:yes gene_type:complete
MVAADSCATVVVSTNALPVLIRYPSDDGGGGEGVGGLGGGGDGGGAGGENGGGGTGGGNGGGDGGGGDGGGDGGGGDGGGGDGCGTEIMRAVVPEIWPSRIAQTWYSPASMPLKAISR